MKKTPNLKNEIKYMNKSESKSYFYKHDLN